MVVAEGDRTRRVQGEKREQKLRNPASIKVKTILSNAFPSSRGFVHAFSPDFPHTLSCRRGEFLRFSDCSGNDYNDHAVDWGEGGRGNTMLMGASRSPSHDVN